MKSYSFFGMIIRGDKVNKKITYILVITIFVSVLSGCTNKTSYTRYTETFFDTFDTVVQIVGYTESEDEFRNYTKIMHDRLLELHKLYDRYNDYEGINNIKTINDNAGIKPVKVDKEIIDLIKFSKEMYFENKQRTNIAFGSVLDVWAKYRDEAELDPENARIPSMEELQEANKHTDINKVIIDEINSTIYLEDPNMRLDVGAVAKGYATEIVIEEIRKEGFNSFIMSSGGNVKAVGKPLDGSRDKWGIGIQDPNKDIFTDDNKILDTVFINDLSVVSSGDYQRYYIVDGERMHHIIDPDTLMPATYYRALTVITANSGEADFYSTEAFLLPFEESKKLVESIDGLEAIWVFPDGSVQMTDGYMKLSKTYGNATSNN